MSKNKKALWVALFGKPAVKKMVKRIRYRTPKRAKEEAAYRRRVKEWLVGKKCVVYPHLRADQVHHQRGRVGSLLLNEKYWIPVSSFGHDLIHSQIEYARKKGWICKVGEWNKSDK